MNELVFEVQGYPPAKNEAKSMLAAGHAHSDRVLALLRAARDAREGERVEFPSGSLGLEVVLTAPSEPPSDATNYLGGIGDVLEDKTRRGRLDDLGDLAEVALYQNDSQLHEVSYRWDPGPIVKYRVRLWMR